MNKVLLIIGLMLLIGCTKEGQVTNKSDRHINIKGKEYKWIKVVPADGEHGIWLLIPEDADVAIPEVTSYRVSCGKNCSEQYTGLWIKS